MVKSISQKTGSLILSVGAHSDRMHAVRCDVRGRQIQSDSWYSEDNQP